MAVPPVVGRRGSVDDDARTFNTAGTRAGSPVPDALGADARDDAATAATAATAASASYFRRFMNALPSIPGLRRAPAAPQAAPGAPQSAPAPTWLDGVRDLREISGVVRELLALAGNPAQIAALRVAALGEPAAPGAAPAGPSDMRVFAEVLRETLPTLTPLLDPWRLADLRAALLGDPADPDAPPAPPSDARVIIEAVQAMLPTLAPLLEPTRLAALRIAAVGDPYDPDAPVAPPSDARMIVEILYAMLPTLTPLLEPERLEALRVAALGVPYDPTAPVAPPSDARVIVETLNAMLPALTPLLEPARLEALRVAALGAPANPTAPPAPHSDARVIVETLHAMLPSLLPLLEPARIEALRTAALGATATTPAAPAGPSDTRIVAETVREVLPLLTLLANPTQLAALRTAALGEPATTTTAPAGPSDTRIIADTVREVLPLLTLLADPIRLAALRTAALGTTATTPATTGPSDTRVMVDAARELIPSLLPLLTQLADPTRLAALRTAALGDPATTPAAPTGPSDTRVIVEAARDMLPSLLPLLNTLANPTQLAALRTAALGDTATATAAPGGPSDTRVIVETLSTMIPPLLPLLERLLNPTQLAALRTAALGDSATATAAPTGPSDSRVIVETLSTMLPDLLPLLTTLADPTRLAALRTAALGDTATTAPAGPSDTRVIAETVRDILPSLTPLLDPVRLAALRTAALGEPTAPGTPAAPSDARVIVETLRDILPTLIPLLDPTRIAALRVAALGTTATTATASTEPSDVRVIAQTAASFLPFLQDAIARPERIAAAIVMIRTAALGAPADPSTPASTTPSDMRVVADTLRGVVDLTNRVITNPEETATAIGTVMRAISPPAPPATATAGPQPAPGPSMMSAAAQIAGAVGNTADLVRRALDDPAGTAAAAGAAATALRTQFMGPPNPDAPSMATSIRDWVVNGITGAAKSVFLEGIIAALNATIPEIEGSNAPVAAQLRQLVETVRETQRTNGDLNVLKANILRIMDGNDALSRILQIHLDNYIPVSLRHMIQPPSESAEDLFSRNIAALGRRPEGPAPDYRQSIAEQKERVVQNVGVMAAMQLANSFCLGKIDPARFPSMIAGIPRDANFIATVKGRFNAELDRNLEISWYRKWIAKSCFRLVTAFSNFFLSRFITGLLGKLDQTLSDNSSQQTQQTHNVAIDRANDFLTILKGVLAAERDNRAPTENYEKRVEKALGKPEFNHGWGRQSLYTAAGAKAVDAFLPPLGWHADFSQRIASLHPVFNYLLHVVAGSFVWFGELISNAFIRSVLKTILYQADVVNQLVTLSESQIERNGYTHAVNKLIFTQLHQIWESLHEPAAPGAAQRSDATVANKQYLRQMIINFFEVLALNRKAQFSTFDPSFIERAREGIHKMSLDLNVDVIALIVDRAKNEFLNPARLPMRVHQTLEVFNAALETETTATEGEMLQLEADIKKLSDMLINKAVEDVIHDRFHADPNQGTADGARFLTMIQTEVTDFTTRVTALLNANQREEAVTLLSTYQNKLRDIQRRVHADPALATDGEVFNRFFGVPLAQKLAELGTLLQQNQPREIIVAKVQEIKTLSDGLAPIFTVNLGMFRVPGKLFEKVAQSIAFTSGKEFLESILAAVRTPYNWRYGAWHHGVLLPLVEAKIPNQFLSLV